MKDTVTIKKVSFEKEGKRTVMEFTKPVILEVVRPDPDAADPIQEALDLEWTVKEIISHLNRDENTNVRNAAAAAGVSILSNGGTEEEVIAAIIAAATDYESGAETIRSKGGAAALLGKAVKWAVSNAEVATAYATTIASEGLEAANKVVIALYNEAHPAKK